MLNRVCVIIPAKGKPDRLKECIDSISGLDYADLEVIVVDDGLEEAGIKILDGFKGRIKILKSNSRGPSYARNLAAKNTTTEYIVFTDSDCIVAKNWLEELSKAFRDYPQAVACGGIQELPRDATNFEKKVFLFMQKAGFISDYIHMAKDIRIREVNHNPSCNVMYKKEVYLKEGGFLEGLWPGEDVEFDYRLKKKGHKLFLNPKAVVYHYKPRTLGQFLKMMYRYGFVQGFLVKRHGVFRRIHFFPISALILVLLFFLLMSIDKVFAFWFIMGVFFLSWFYFLDFASFLLFLSGGFLWNAGFIMGLIKNIF
jgi:cellulose synthase/poly-beta-1,6-N-acetylglucosamine synthase-like glycosyltransferase